MADSFIFDLKSMKLFTDIGDNVIRSFYKFHKDSMNIYSVIRK